MPTPVDCAYAAGFFDGEGCVLINTRRMVRARSVLYRMRVQVTQNNREPLDWLCERWGGVVVRRTRRPNNKVPHDWKLESVGSVAFLKDVLPYLIVKRSQADIALEFQSLKYNPGGAGIPIELTARYEALRLALLEARAASDMVGNNMEGQHPDYVAS